MEARYAAIAANGGRAAKQRWRGGGVRVRVRRPIAWLTGTGLAAYAIDTAFCDGSGLSVAILYPVAAGALLVGGLLTVYQRRGVKVATSVPV